MKKIEFKENMKDLEYSIYLAQCLYLGINPNKRK